MGSFNLYIYRYTLLNIISYIVSVSVIVIYNIYTLLMYISVI